MNAPFFEIGNIHNHIDCSPHDWRELAELWEDLPLDRYMGDNGSYRRRRFSTISYNPSTADKVRVLDHTSFSQPKEINQLNGGVRRLFEPVDQRLFKNTIVTRTLDHFANKIDGPGSWQINVHQHRITATQGEPGQPTPEGIHRDGVDHVVMMLIDRVDVQGGTSTLYNNAKLRIATHCLTVPGEYIFLNDNTCMHSVSPVEAAPSATTGRRDMLFFEFKP